MRRRRQLFFQETTTGDRCDGNVAENSLGRNDRLIGARTRSLDREKKIDDSIEIPRGIEKDHGGRVIGIRDDKRINISIVTRSFVQIRA